MIRLSLLCLLLTAVITVGFRNCFWSLCALIVLAALEDHHNFKVPFLGISGLKPWNILFVPVVLQWATQRRAQRSRGGIPPLLVLGLGGFVLAVVWGALLGLLEPGALASRTGWSATHFAVETIVNPLKLLVPAVLLFDMAYTPRRVLFGLLAAIGLCAVFAILIIKYIPASSLLDPDSVLRYRLRTQKLIGLHPNDIISTLVPGIWTMFFLWRCVRGRVVRGSLLVLIVSTGIALLLTQSRTGMVAFFAVALGLGVLRYRRIGFGALAILFIGVVALPSLSRNWSRGFDVETVEGTQVADINEVTNGRYQLWQGALADIRYAPIIGNGKKYAARYPSRRYELHGHPHNAYLEIWVEDGLLALLVILICFTGLAVVAVRLVRHGRTRLEVLIGTCATACVITHFVVGLGGRAFTPRISAVFSYCVVALALRLYYCNWSAGLGGRNSVPNSFPAGEPQSEWVPVLRSANRRG